MLTFGAALISRFSGDSASWRLLSWAIPYSTSTTQLSSLSFGFSEAWFPVTQFSVSAMLPGALSWSLSTGWRLILQIQQTFKIWVRCPGRSFADNGGGNGDISDIQNSAAPCCWKSDSDAMTISAVSGMYPKADICWFSVNDSFCVAHMFCLPCHICKSREPWPLWAVSCPPPLCSFPSRFLCSHYPILYRCLPKSRFWYKYTAIPPHFRKGSRLGFLPASSR